MSSTYTLTVKFAPSGTTYVHPKSGKISTSSVGHVWLEARESGQKEPFSAGWSTGEEITKVGEDNLSHDDWKAYKENNDHHIHSITVKITKEQFEKLKEYPDLAATGRIEGFRSVEAPQNGFLGLGGIDYPGKPPRNHDTHYNVFTNSCIDFAGQGLAHIGLAGKNFDGNPLLMPDKQIEDFLEQMAKHSRSDISVRFEGKTHILKDGENLEKFWDKVAPNRHDVPYYMQNEPQQAQETLYVHNAPDREQPLQTAEEYNPFLAYLENNPVTAEDAERFMQSVQDYDNELREQEMMMAMQQSRGRGMSM